MGGGAEGSEGPTGEGKYMKKRTCLNIRGQNKDQVSVISRSDSLQRSESLLFMYSNWTF